MRKVLAILFVALGMSGVLAAAAPSASADPLIHYDLEGTISDDAPEPGGPVACVNPYIKLFGNVVLDDPICI